MIADRFHIPPSQAEAEDVTVLRRLALERLAHGGAREQEGGEDW